MIPFLRLVEIVFRPSGDHVFLMLQVELEHIQKVQYFRFVIDKRQHDDAEGVLHLGVLVQTVQHHVGIGVAPKLDHHAGPLPVGFVPQIRDAVYFFLLMELCDLFDQTGLVHHIRKLRHDDLALSVGKGLDIGHRPHPDLSSAGPVGLFAASGPQDQSAGGKIGRLHQRKHFLDIRIPVLVHPVIDDLHYGAYHLAQIVRRDIGGHSHRDAAGAVHQKIGIPRGQDHRLFFRFIEVRSEIHGILVDIREHLHGDLRQPGLGITHGRGAVPVLGAEVSVAVHQGITGGPFLRHIDQRPVNGAVSVGMVFTHGIADDTGAFSVRLVRTVVQLDHGVKHAPLHGLQSVSHIRKGPGCDDAHGVVDVGGFHGLL